MKKIIFFDFFIPIILLLLVTAIFRFTNFDITLSKPFYTNQQGWIYKNAPICKFFYQYGEIPAFLLVAYSLLGSIWFFTPFTCKKANLFLFLFLILCPGLVVNGLFKNHWGRPRPRQIIAFGGSRQFLPVWQKGISGKGRSFPSGHSAMAFFLLSPFFLFRKIDKKWAKFSLLFGLIFGSVMGTIRIIQGGHFASDVLWSAGFTYIIGLMLYYLLHLDKNNWWKI